MATQVPRRRRTRELKFSPEEVAAIQGVERSLGYSVPRAAPARTDHPLGGLLVAALVIYFIVAIIVGVLSHVLDAFQPPTQEQNIVAPQPVQAQTSKPLTVSDVAEATMAGWQYVHDADQGTTIYTSDGIDWISEGEDYAAFETGQSCDNAGATWKAAYLYDPALAAGPEVTGFICSTPLPTTPTGEVSESLAATDQKNETSATSCSAGSLQTAAAEPPDSPTPTTAQATAPPPRSADQPEVAAETGDTAEQPLGLQEGYEFRNTDQLAGAMERRGYLDRFQQKLAGRDWLTVEAHEDIEILEQPHFDAKVIARVIAGQSYDAVDTQLPCDHQSKATWKVAWLPNLPSTTGVVCTIVSAPRVEARSRLVICPN